MAKYIVKNIDIMHHNKLFKEGSVIELEEDEADELSYYLEPVIKKQDKKKGKSTENDVSAKDENSTGAKENIEVNNAQNT